MNNYLEATVAFKADNYNYELVRDWLTEKSFEFTPLKFGYLVNGNYDLFTKYFGEININTNTSIVDLPIPLELEPYVCSISVSAVETDETV